MGRRSASGNTMAGDAGRRFADRLVAWSTWITLAYGASFVLVLFAGRDTPGVGSLAALVQLSGLVALTLAGRRLRAVLRAHDRALARERTLRTAGAALVAALDAEAVYAAAISAGRELIRDVPNARLSLAVGTLDSMRIVGSTGDRASEVVGAEVQPALFPEPMRSAVAAHEPVLAVDVRPEDLRDAVSYVPKTRALSVLPLVVRDELRGMFMLGDGEHLDDQGIDVLRALGALTVLALESNGIRGELQLRQSERRFRSLVQNSSDVTLVVGTDGTAIYESPAAKRVLGHRVDGTATGNIFELVHPDDQDAVARWLAEIAETPDVERSADVRLRHMDGSWRVIEATGRNALDDPEVGGVVVNYRDITARRRAESQLLHQAFHDSLTNLPNRALFKDRLEHALSRRAAPGSIAVIFLDLDDFKSVNDSFGHSVGDELLIAVADRLRGAVRAGDTVVRFGGDEFAILLEELDGPEAALASADRIVRALRTPVILRGKPISAPASLGIVFNETAFEPVDDLLRNADVAMYRAKRAGKGRYEVFHAEMHHAVVDRLEMKEDLRRALQKRELVLHYQPIVEIGTGRLVSLEALLRWDHPERGVVQPLSFIGLAEETGLIVPIGRWVMREATRQAAAWQRAFAAEPPIGMNVNLSARQLDHPELVRHVATALASSGLAPGSLTLEITESMLIADAGRVSTLEALHDLGVCLAIDDFGTGYSSLSYISRFPIDMLKIDKSFIDDVATPGEGSIVPRLMIELGEKLGVLLVAEGVERTEQVTALKALDCRLAQGFFFAAPLEAGDVPALLQGQEVVFAERR